MFRAKILLTNGKSIFELLFESARLFGDLEFSRNCGCLSAENGQREEGQLLDRFLSVGAGIE